MKNEIIKQGVNTKCHCHFNVTAKPLTFPLVGHRRVGRATFLQTISSGIGSCGPDVCWCHRTVRSLNLFHFLRDKTTHVMKLAPRGSPKNKR